MVFVQVLQSHYVGIFNTMNVVCFSAFRNMIWLSAAQTRHESEYKFRIYR